MLAPTSLGGKPMEHATVAADAVATPAADADRADPGAAARGLFAREWRAVTIGCIALISMLAFEALAVTTAMPTVARALDGLALYALAFGATLATSAIGMVQAGLASDRDGPGPSLRQGALWFGLGLLVAGLAQQMGTLVLGRALLGFGSGQISVALYVAVARLYPEQLRARIFAMFAAAWVVPALIGPALASLMVDTLGWRSVFLAVLVLLPPAWWPVDRALRGFAGAGVEPGGNRRRLLAATLAAAAAAALHLLGQQPAPNALALLAASLLLALAAAPLLPVGTLRARRGLPTIVALRGLLAAAFFTAEAFLPLWLQQGRAWSVLAAGVALSAGAVLWSVGSQAQARLPAAWRPRVLQSGLAVVAAGLAIVAACVMWSLPAALAVAAWLCCGFGIGLSFPSLSVLLLELSPRAEQGRNSAALQLADALATTAALALAGSAFAQLHQRAPQQAFVLVFALAAALLLVAVALAPRAARAA
jgi:MFS family permease